jgi:hypothetical protein
MRKIGAKMRKASGLAILLLVLAFSVSYLKADELDPGTTAVVAETAFIPNLTSPLANLDLIPDPVSVSAIDFNPRNFVFGGSRGTAAATYFGGSKVGDKVFEASLVSIVALNIADYFTTTEALKYSGLQEGNPVMKGIVKSPVAFAAVKIGISAVSCISFKSMYKKNKAAAWVLSTVTNLAMSYVVSNNLHMINQAKAHQI